MSGQFSPTGGIAGLNQNLYYRVYGWDVTLRHIDRMRVHFEYARRDSDNVDFANVPFRTRDHIDGYYIEWRISILLPREKGLVPLNVLRLAPSSASLSLPPVSACQREASSA